MSVTKQFRRHQIVVTLWQQSRDSFGKVWHYCWLESLIKFTVVQLILGKSTPWSVAPLAMFSQYIPTCASKIVKYAYQETKKINVVSYWSWQVSSYYGKAPQESLYLNLIKFVILWSKKLFAIAIFYFISTLSNWLNDQLIERLNIAQNGPFSRPLI